MQVVTTQEEFLRIMASGPFILLHLKTTCRKEKLCFLLRSLIVKQLCLSKIMFSFDNWIVFVFISFIYKK